MRCSKKDCSDDVPEPWTEAVSNKAKASGAEKQLLCNRDGDYSHDNIEQHKVRLLLGIYEVFGRYISPLEYYGIGEVQ